MEVWEVIKCPNSIKDEYNKAMKQRETYDVWGELQVWLPFSINGVEYGAEYNIACDNGQDQCAYYLTITDNYEDEFMETVTSVCKSPSCNPMDFKAVIKEMKDFVVMYIIQHVIDERFICKTFITDAEKMYDFFILSKDEFLESYSYLTEEEYDATKEYVGLLNAIREEN